MIAEYILLIFFMLLNMSGLFLILLRTGDYEADMFTKILGWILFLPCLIGLVVYYQWIGIILFFLGSIITFFIKQTFKKD